MALRKLREELKMALQENLQEFKLRNNGSGSFTLTKLWVEKAADLELSATAVSVMTALLWHYNPAKKYVYPHQETISKRIKRSVATVKRALAELKQAGFIVSSRTRNGNLYAFTQAFFDTLQSPLCTEPQAQNEPCMRNEHEREQRTNNMAVVVSLKDFREGEEGTKKASSTAAPIVSSETFKEIPLCLKKKAEKGEIHNLSAYWKSLRNAVKMEYIEQDQKEREAAERKAELKKQVEEQKAQELEEKRKLQEEMSKPLTERWTKEGAIKLIWNMRGLIKNYGIKTGIAYDLAQAFGLNVETIIQMSESEVNKSVCL